jgi:hypothetical protein
MPQAWPQPKFVDGSLDQLEFVRPWTIWAEVVSHAGYPEYFDASIEES